MAYLDENGLEHFWGKIKDRVSSAVAPKADDADVVHKAGDVTIDGVVTFQNTAEGHDAGGTVTDLIIRNPEVDRGTLVEGGRSYTRVILADREGDTEETFVGRLGLLEVQSPKEDDTLGPLLTLGCYKFSDSLADAGKFAAICVGYDLDGTAFAWAPATSDERTDSTDIVTRGYMEASEWNWQKTKKNALVQFKPVPESDLEPVVDFMFTETPPASGEKGPSNPSTITGVSSAKVTRCGKNLLPSEYAASSMAQRGITVTNNADGSYHFSGTSSSSATPYMYFFASTAGVVPDAFRPGEYFTISIQCDSPEVLFRVYVSDSATAVGNVYYTAVNGSPKTFTISDTTKTLFFSLLVNTGKTIDCDVRCQIEYGKTVTEWETPVDNAYTIQLGNTYYGGSLDVATGVMTVGWEGVVLDGTENWIEEGSVGSGVYRYKLSNDYNDNYHPSGNSNQICTHFDYLQSWTSATVHWYSSTPDGNMWFFSDVQTTLADWKTWLAAQKTAGTPVTVVAKVYKFTIQLTPTQIRSLPAIDKYEPRINTVYTDQEAVQVGYQRYVDEDNLVHKTGNETINGAKNFTSAIGVTRTTNGSIAFKSYFDIPANTTYFQDMVLTLDSAESMRYAALRVYPNGDGNTNRIIGLYTFNINNTLGPGILIGVDQNNNHFAQAPSTSLSRNTAGDILTRDWIPKDTRIVHTTGNETIAGEKTFSNRLILHGTLNISENDVYIINNSARNRYYLCRFTNLANGSSYDSSVCATVLGLQANNGDIPVALYNQISTNGDVSNVLRHNHVSGSDPAQFIFYSQVGKYEGTVYCNKDNKYKLGDSNVRWTAVYAATGSINTSDERLKTEIAPMPDNVLDAWEGVEWKQFKFTDSVNEKGLDAARLHAGAVAQSIDAVFSAAGLDAGRYGFFCHDSWDAEPEQLDENGDVISVARPAGDRYSLRYEEALCMEAAYMRRENARLKKRVADLEERLAALELKIS